MFSSSQSVDAFSHCPGLFVPLSCWRDRASTLLSRPQLDVHTFLKDPDLLLEGIYRAICFTGSDRHRFWMSGAGANCRAMWSRPNRAGDKSQNLWVGKWERGGESMMRRRKSRRESATGRLYTKTGETQKMKPSRRMK